MEHISLMCQNKTVHNLTAGMDVSAARSSFSKRTYSRKNSKMAAADTQNQQVPENG